MSVDKEKQITKSCKNCVCNVVCDKKLDLKYFFDNHDCEHYQPKLPEDSVVLSREEYEKLKNLSNLIPKLSLENLKLKEEQKEMQRAIAKDNSVNWLLKQDRRITEKRVSNEMAEKILNKFDDIQENLSKKIAQLKEPFRRDMNDREKESYINGVLAAKSIVTSFKSQISKQFGVEIKE